QCRPDRVVAEDVMHWQSVGHRLDVVHRDLRDLVNVAEDRFELTGQLRELLVGQGEPREPGDVADVVEGEVLVGHVAMVVLRRPIRLKRFWPASPAGRASGAYRRLAGGEYSGRRTRWLRRPVGSARGRISRRRAGPGRNTR